MATTTNSGREDAEAESRHGNVKRSLQHLDGDSGQADAFPTVIVEDVHACRQERRASAFAVPTALGDRRGLEVDVLLSAFEPGAIADNLVAGHDAIRADHVA